MSVAPITQAEINNVVVTRNGVTLSVGEESGNVIKTTVGEAPDKLRTRAVYLLALANYIDNPPAPPFDFPPNHAAVITGEIDVEGSFSVVRFTRLEDAGWFSRGFGWKDEAAIRRDFHNLRVVSEGVPNETPAEEAPGE
ncbi:hypothetical protein SEA_COLUCCI_71 [Arthrobacter phage Colucci]|uniref:Uncharacterized protein n=1 Tax=Arthrobacter phage Colucci TaxID=2015834 RepID=A0A286N2Y3_9CAUD|nr:hypothetical protein FDI27_gp071 [Arthrobacter phage Colucci]ASX98740.1 hypothetical protein SEA_COLUCCI_71 [Arthrobacter phage Colucci]